MTLSPSPPSSPPLPSSSFPFSHILPLQRRGPQLRGGSSRRYASGGKENAAASSASASAPASPSTSSTIPSPRPPSRPSGAQRVLSLPARPKKEEEEPVTSSRKEAWWDLGEAEQEEKPGMWYL
ncbi:hypothetical protein JCM6882_008214 [Rhodosporidiobolus microsporus]